jgi:hypothetical protein
LAEEKGLLQHCVLPCFRCAQVEPKGSHPAAALNEKRRTIMFAFFRLAEEKGFTTYIHTGEASRIFKNRHGVALFFYALHFAQV